MRDGSFERFFLIVDRVLIQSDRAHHVVGILCVFYLLAKYCECVREMSK